MQIEEKPQGKEYTYKDYLTWADDEHWELIDGKAYPTYGMTALAAPTTAHQNLVVELVSLIRNYLRGKSCQVFVSPTDVVFEESENTKTVVQPDLLVVCDSGKIREKNIVGAPDIIIEVLSPSTAPKDWLQKLRIYESQGVKEYWIVNPDERIIYKNVLQDCQYQMKVLEEGQLTSAVLEDFSLDVGEFFSVLDIVDDQGRAAADQKARELRARQEGRQERSIEIAKKLLQKGNTPEDVADFTDLDIAFIESLKSEIQ